MTDKVEFDDLDFNLIDDPNPTPTPKDIVVDDPKPDPVPAPEPELKKKPGRKKAEVVIVDDEPEPPAPKPVDPPAPDDNDEPEESLFETIAQRLGYEFQEDETYEEDEDGVAKFVESVSDKLADQKLNSFLDSLPPVASEFFDYLNMLGENATEDKVKEFFTSVNRELDYKSIDLNNEDVQKSVLKTFFREAGMEDDEIKETLEDFEVGGLLKKQATIAAAKLDKRQEAKRQELLESERQADLKRKADIQEFWGNVDKTIKTGKVQNLSIPVSEQKVLLEYMSKPTKSGKSAMSEDLAKLTVEDRVALAVWLKNKGNLGKYVQAAASTQRVASLRDKLKGGAPKFKGAGSNNSIEDDIDFTIK